MAFLVPTPHIILQKEEFKMDILKKVFPYSFKAKDGVAGLIINILVYLVVGLVAGALIGIFAKLPIIGILIGLLGGLVDLYVLAGIVISVLDYLKVLK